MHVNILDLIPPEVLAVICSYACTDDGTTGRSLSLVCRYLRNVSEHVRYQSVAVLGMFQITSLTDILLERAAHGSKDVVRSMFLSAFDRAGRLPWSKYFSGKVPRYGGYDIRRMTMSIALVEQRRAAATISRLLALIAGDVRTLAVLGIELEIAHIGRPFPYLKELIVTSLQPPLVRTNQADPLLPSLQRIQVQRQQAGGTNTLFLSLALYAPYDTITHLHILNVGDEVARYLRIQLHIPIASPFGQQRAAFKPGSVAEAFALSRAALFTRLQNISIEVAEDIMEDHKQGLLELFKDCHDALTISPAGCGVLNLLPQKQSEVVSHEALENWLNAFL
jgi:hypothetical protein